MLGSSQPVDSEGTHDVAEKYNAWLLENEIPKLFFWADPGKMIPLHLSKMYSEKLKYTKSVGVGHAKHYLQEDHPHLTGMKIGQWLESTGLDQIEP